MEGWGQGILAGILFLASGLLALLLATFGIVRDEKPAVFAWITVIIIMIGVIIL